MRALNHDCQLQIYLSLDYSILVYIIIRALVGNSLESHDLSAYV